MKSSSPRISKYLQFTRKSVCRNTAHRFILVISHMRARTTLLTHILASHQGICGHKESYISYDRQFSKTKLKIECSSQHNYSSSIYVTDKLLHNKLTIDSNLFTPDELKSIFILRQPADTLSSMAKMHIKVNNNENYTHLADYYQERLLAITEMAIDLRKRYLYLDSDALAKNTTPSLTSLSNYLQLPEPLSENYKIFDDTGVAGKGDPSQNIQAGRIIDTGAKKKLLAFVSEERMNELNALYRTCRDDCISNAIESIIQ